MSASAARSQSGLERLAKLTRLGGWLFVVGLVLCLLAAVGLAALGLGSTQRAVTAALSQPSGLAAGALSAIGALIALAGLALYVVVPGLDPQLARRDFDSVRVILACLAAVFVLGNVLTIPTLLANGPSLGAASTGSGLQLSVPTLVIALLATQLSIMAVLVWRVVRPGALTWEDMGLSVVHLERRLAQGVVGGIIIFVLSGLIGIGMRGLGIEQTQMRMFEGIRGVAPAQFMAFWLAAAVVAPICEECFFRGYVFAALRRRYGRLIAYPLAAVLFAAIHFNLPAIVPIIVMALCLSFLYDRSDSVVPGIVAHALNNSVALTLLYAGLGG